MTGLGMRQAVHNFPVDDDACANAGSNGEVHQRFQPLIFRYPGKLSKGRRVNVQVESHGYIELLANGPEDIRIAPAGFGSCGDAAVAWGGRVQVQWAKGGQADGGQLVFLEKGDYPIHCFMRCCGWEADLVNDFIRPCAHRTDELGPAAFHAAVEFFHMVLLFM